MTGNEIIDYLTDKTARDLTDTDQQLAVITAALDYGYWPDPWELLAYDTAMLMKVNGLGVTDTDYDEDLRGELETTSRYAANYLNDNGITPAAYDHGETDPTVGYGNSTARDGAARLDGAGSGVAGWQRDDREGVKI